MKIIVGLNISSRSYFFETENSRAYVSNEKTHMNYLFEGKSADIWTVIFETRNYEIVLEYAKKHGVEKQLELFISELNENGLINTENSETEFFISGENKYYNLSEEFEKERNLWFRQNGIFIQLILELSYTCNLNCKHCYNDKKSGFMPFSQIKQIIDSAFELGFYAICLTGGECTLHENFLEIAEYIRKKGFNLFIYTNGQKLYDDNDFFQKFIELYPSSVKISLYSMNEKIHDKITGVEGSHRKTLAVIKKLKENNIAVFINFFMLHENYGEMAAVQKFANEQGIIFNADSRFTNNINRKNSNVQICPEEYRQLFNIPDNYFNADLEIYNEINDKFLSQRVCNAGSDRLSISPSLDVYPCSGVSYKLGNIQDYSLAEIVNCERFKTFKKEFVKSNMSDCYKNEYCKYCFYCPSLDYNGTNFLSPVGLCCERAKILNDLHKKGVIYAG